MDEQRKTIFPFLVSILPPSVFLLYLYRQNAEYLLFWHSLVVIVIFTIGAIILQLLVSKLVKSFWVAALINNILWILFFTIKEPYLFFLNYFDKNILVSYTYMSIMGVITIIVISLMVRYKNKLQKQEIFKVLSIFWLMVLILNAVPVFVCVARDYSKHAKFDANDYKTDFNVDTILPSPNIYWLLMDGMLGFKAMEHLFNNPQSEFTAQLTERGFIINREAQFEALHSTKFTIPALMCPNYYDAFFVPALRNCDLNDYKQKMKLRDVIRKTADFARSRNELISAFDKKGYQTNTIGFITHFEFVNFNTSYLYLSEKQIISNDGILDVLANLSSKRNVKNTLYQATILREMSSIIDVLFDKYENSILNVFDDIQNHHPQISNVFKSFFGEFYQGDDRWYLNALAGIMNNSSPTLTIIHDLKAHVPFIYDEHGNLIKRKLKKKSMDPYNYPPQHHFTSSIIISYIDFILNADPEAVIVLQSDHGLHEEENRKQLISKHEKNDDDVRLMQNQTISAVRIPDMENGQPIEPLNITRVLVNRYVGDNYELLDPENIIK